MHPTQDRPARPPRRIELDSGEILDLDEVLTGDAAESGYVQLRMPAVRALDLAEVLRAYGRIVGLVSAAAEVSSTEDSLATALRDSGRAARGERAAMSAERSPSAVTAGSRLLAMAMLQQTKPALSHTALVGIIDAAARWIEEDEHDFALGVVEAAAGEQLAPTLWLTLLGQHAPGAGQAAGGSDT